MPSVQHYLIFIDSVRSLHDMRFCVSSKTCGASHIVAGDILWFVQRSSGGLLVATATFTATQLHLETDIMGQQSFIRHFLFTDIIDLRGLSLYSFVGGGDPTLHFAFQVPITVENCS